MKLHAAHGGAELAEHHSWLVFDIPIEMSTYLPNGSSSPLTSSGRMAFRRARAAESWPAGG